jgi:hypothetical protein
MRLSVKNPSIKVKMQTARSFENLVSYSNTTLSHNPEDIGVRISTELYILVSFNFKSDISEHLEFKVSYLYL